MSLLSRSLARAALALAIAAPVAAQSTETAGPGGTAAFIGGGVATSSTAGPLIGGTFVFDVNTRVSLEGQGAWLGRGSGSDALTLNGSLLVSLLPLGRRVVPYAAVGGGLYRASFDLGNRRLLGLVGADHGPGTRFCPSPGSGYMRGSGPNWANCAVDGTAGLWGVGRMPQFYARRLGMLVVPMGRMWEPRTFTDPAVTFGGRVCLNLARHIELRPDARGIVIVDGGSSYTVGVFGVNIGYRF
jgi:hypothetical protein